jgi:hypothetical protein
MAIKEKIKLERTSMEAEERPNKLMNASKYLGDYMRCNRILGSQSCISTLASCNLS